MILGVHQLERQYLVSDTRLTEGQFPDGTNLYSYDFLKFFPFNERLGFLGRKSGILSNRSVYFQVRTDHYIFLPIFLVLQTLGNEQPYASL